MSLSNLQMYHWRDKERGLPISNHLRSDYSGYNPAHPDALDSFKWNDDSPFTEIEKAGRQLI